MSESGSGEDETDEFRVVDRRRFEADGSDRVADKRRTSASSPPASAPDAKVESGATAEEALGLAGEPQADASRDGDDPRASFVEAGEPASAAFAGGEFPPGASATQAPVSGEPQAPTFSSLILSLSTQALFSLGEIAESPDAEPQVDLLAGKQLIDLLGVLQEKTSGNLDAGESELMERILYDLRLRFVEIARRPSPRSPEN